MNERSITITEWIEPKCPYCRYVYYSVLRDIQVRRVELNRKLVKQGHYPMPLIEIKLVDVVANVGCKEMQWFEQYSHKIGGTYTPAIRVGNSGKIYYLWGKDKQATLEKSQLSSTAKLKSEIIQEIQDILMRLDQEPKMYDKELFNHLKSEIAKPSVMFTPKGGFTI